MQRRIEVLSVEVSVRNTCVAKYTISESVILNPLGTKSRSLGLTGKPAGLPLWKGELVMFYQKPVHFGAAFSFALRSYCEPSSAFADKEELPKG